jgi:hypothetical protein
MLAKASLAVLMLCAVQHTRARHTGTDMCCCCCCCCRFPLKPPRPQLPCSTASWPCLMSQQQRPTQLRDTTAPWPPQTTPVLCCRGESPRILHLHPHPPHLHPHLQLNAQRSSQALFKTLLLAPATVGAWTGLTHRCAWLVGAVVWCANYPFSISGTITVESTTQPQPHLGWTMARSQH